MLLEYLYKIYQILTNSQGHSRGQGHSKGQGHSRGQGHSKGQGQGHSRGQGQGQGQDNVHGIPRHTPTQKINDRYITDSIIDSIIVANDNVINLLQSNTGAIKKIAKCKHIHVQDSGQYSEQNLEQYQGNQIGAGLDELSEIVSKLTHNIESFLKKTVNDTGARLEKFREITEVSILLIRFLGEMIETNNNDNHKKVQEQIVTITENFLNYL